MLNSFSLATIPNRKRNKGEKNYSMGIKHRLEAARCGGDEVDGCELLSHGTGPAENPASKHPIMDIKSGHYHDLYLIGGPRSVPTV